MAALYFTLLNLQYKKIARKVFEGFNRLVESVLKKAELDVLDVYQVTLPGGTSHTPKFTVIIASMFRPTTKILALLTTLSAVSP